MKKGLWIVLAAFLWLCCAASAENDVTLKLNGSADAAMSALSNERIRFTVEAPGATAVRLVQDDGNELRTEQIWEGQYSNTVCLEQEWMFQEGTYVFLAQARYDSYGDTNLWDDPWENSAESGRITLTVTSRGLLPEPSAAWTGENTASGLNWLRVQITQPMNMGEWYWADIGIPKTNGDVEWFDQMHFAEDNTLAFPAARFDPGYYAMDVFAGAYGYQNRPARLYFTVTMPGQAMPEGLMLSRDTVSAGESLEIAGYVPGAEELRFVIRKNQDPTWTDRQERGGPLGTLEKYRFPDPGEYTVTLYVWDGENDLEVCSELVTVGTAAEGKLSRPVFADLPAVLEPGEGLAGTVLLDERATDCGIRLEYCPENADWQEIFRTDRTVENGQTALDLPAALFTRSGRYRLQIWTSAAFLQQEDADYWFLQQETGGQIAMTVNGGDSDIASWPSSSDLVIRAEAPGATALRLLWNGEWNYQDCFGGSVEWRMGLGNGDYVFVVQMTDAEPMWREDGFDWGSFRWESLGWSAVSNTVRVHVESPNGAKTEPAVTLSAESLPRGEMLTIMVEPQGSDEWYWMDILQLKENDGGTDFHWENIGHRDFGNDPVLRLSTLALEEGEYYLQIGIDGEGWDGKQTLRRFTVLEAEGDLPEAALEFSRETMQANESVDVTAYALGCEHFVLEIRRDGDPNWRDGRDDWGEDTYTWGWGCGSGGEYTFILYYWLPGDTEARSLSSRFTVTSDGALEAPEFTDVPAVLDMGSGFNGRFSAVDGAAWYSLGIRYSENGWDWEDVINEDRNASDPDANLLCFDGSVFSRPGAYRLWVSAAVPGKDNGYREAEILVTDPASLSDGLVLRVNGETDGSLVEAYLHQELRVTAEAPQNVTAVRVRCTTSGWEYRSCREEYAWTLGVHQGGESVFQVQASTDTAVLDWQDDHGSMEGFDWESLSFSMTGSPVIVNVIYYGDLEAPDMEFPNGTQVERGRMLAYRISPVEHGWGYGIQVRQVLPDGSAEDALLVDMQLEGLREPLLTALPTDMLEAGSYRLYVDPRCYGWHGDQRGYDFTVTEPEGWQDQPVFRSGKTEYLTQEPMIFSAYAPGASAMRLCSGGLNNIWFEAEGDTLADRVVPYFDRVYQAMAYADYGDGEWVQIGDTLATTVTAPYGALDASMTAPETVRADASWSVSLTYDDLGTDGSAECYMEDREGNLQECLLLEEREENGRTTAVWQVEANTLEPGVYTVSGYAIPGRQGYAPGTAEQWITVSPGDPAGTLTVDKTEADPFEDVEVTVHVPGATAVGIHEDGWGWICRTGDTMTEGYPMWNDGLHVFYGRYTYDEIDPEAPGFDWENVHWEGFTNAEAVLVHPPLGTLEEPQFMVSATEAERGDVFEVTVTSVYEGVEDVVFGAHLIPAEDESFGLPWFGPDVDGIIRVSTAEAAPGAYILEVSANAVKWMGSGKRIRVTVKPVAEAVTVLQLPAGLTCIEAEAFAGTGAEKIIVPRGVTRIENRAFADCPNLKLLELPEGITFEGKPLEGTRPVFVYGAPGSYLEAYAEEVEGLYFIPIT